MDTPLVKTSRDGGAGYSRGELRGGDWTSIAHAVKAPSDAAADLSLYVKAHQMRRATHAVACDWTAAALWGLPLPAAIGLELDSIPLSLASLGTESHDRSSAVKGRRRLLPAGHVTEHRGIALTTPSRTWLDCSAFLSPAFSIAMADAILHRGLASLDEMRSAVTWGRGRRGVRTARDALSLSDGRAESPRESWVRAHLMSLGVPRPEVNIDVFDESGRWIARVDMAWPSRRVILEYDGREFHGPEQQEHDHTRRERLRDAGWTVIVIRAEDVADMPLVASRIRRALGYATV